MENKQQAHEQKKWRVEKNGLLRNILLYLCLH